MTDNCYIHAVKSRFGRICWDFAILFVHKLRAFNSKFFFSNRKCIISKTVLNRNVIVVNYTKRPKNLSSINPIVEDTQTMRNA